MPALLVLAFVIVPLIELAVILQVGQLIGTGWTITLLVADSLAGAYLLKRESRRAWHDFRTALASGRWPGDEVTQGGLVIVGGTLLLTPGFVTDALGLLALLPPTRAVLSRAIRRRVVPGAVLGTRSTRRTAPGPRGPRTAPQGPRTGPRGPRTGLRGQAPPEDPGPQVLDVEVVDIEREPPRDR